MENRDKILEKLRKLMNLKESAISIGNEGEANAAAAGISRLLMMYNLSEEDIPEQERLENPVVSEEIPYKFKEGNGPWYAQLISVVCQFNMCRSLVVSTYKIDKGRMTRDKFQIVGRKKNVEVVLYLVSFLAHQFVSTGKIKYDSYKRQNPFGYTRAIYLKSFLYGCVVGLGLKLQEEKNQLKATSNITALVCSCNKEIDDFLSGTKISKSNNNYKPQMKSNIGYCSGIEAGMKAQIHEGIYSDSVSEERRLGYV